MARAGSQKSGSKRRSTRTAVMRRPPEKGLPRLQHNVRGLWRDSLELSPLWIVLFVLASTWCLLPRQVFFVPMVEAGSIAARTYIADQDLSVPNEAQTEVMQRRARDEVLPVYDFDEHDGNPYLVMRFIEGETLKARLAGRSLDPDEAVAMIQDVGDALTYAHGQGVIRRDIKPSNVLLTGGDPLLLSTSKLEMPATPFKNRRCLTRAARVVLLASFSSSSMPSS